MIYTLIGFLGPILFVWAYAMVSFGYWHAGMVRTHVPNLLGALCLVVSLTHSWNLPTFILECCWASISLYGIAKALRRP